MLPVERVRQEGGEGFRILDRFSPVVRIRSGRYRNRGNTRWKLSIRLLDCSICRNASRP
jgi:hypothetical protein